MKAVYNYIILYLVKYLHGAPSSNNNHHALKYVWLRDTNTGTRCSMLQHCIRASNVSRWEPMGSHLRETKLMERNTVNCYFREIGAINLAVHIRVVDVLILDGKKLKED